MNDHKRKLCAQTHGKIPPPPKSENVCVLQISQNIDGLHVRQNNSQGFLEFMIL